MGNGICLMTIYNQSDKMKMPYNTLQTERRNLYGV